MQRSAASGPLGAARRGTSSERCTYDWTRLASRLCCDVAQSVELVKRFSYAQVQSKFSPTTPDHTTRSASVRPEECALYSLEGAGSPISSPPKRDPTHLIKNWGSQPRPDRVTATAPTPSTEPGTNHHPLQPASRANPPTNLVATQMLSARDLREHGCRCIMNAGLQHGCGAAARRTVVSEASRTFPKSRCLPVGREVGDRPNIGERAGDSAMAASTIDLYRTSST